MQGDCFLIYFYTKPVGLNIPSGFYCKNLKLAQCKEPEILSNHKTNTYLKIKNQDNVIINSFFGYFKNNIL